MKSILKTALIFAVIAVAGCVNFPSAGQAEVSTGMIDVKSSDISVNVKLTPSEVLSGRQTTLDLAVKNIRDNTNINNISVYFYDRCGFTGGEDRFEINELKPNRTYYNKTKWIAPSTNFERVCNIKLKVVYNANTYLKQDVAVLNDAEYTARQSAGTLSSIPLQSSGLAASLSISFRLSENQPLRQTAPGEKVYAYINIQNAGNGYIEKLKEGDVNITYPSNLKGECSGFVMKGKNAINNRTFSFYQNKAPQITCSFDAIPSEPIDIKTFVITVNYKYQLDNSLNVKIATR